MSTSTSYARGAERKPDALRAITIETLDTKESSAWDDFVRSHPDGSFFHLVGWSQIIETCFEYRRFLLAAFREQEIVGVLPLFHCRSLLAGSSLISVPFAVRGGILARDEWVSGQLLARAIELARALRVEYLELRSEKPISEELATKNLYVTFRADLSLSEDVLLKRMDRKRRQMLNYAARAGYTFRLTDAAELPAFYRLFAKSMRSHGTPVHSRRFLAEMFRQQPAGVNLGLVYKGNALLAGTMSLLFESTIMPFYAGIDRERRPRAVDEFMYWSLIQWAKARGFRTFDFGRSRKGTGAYKFKARWGMDEAPLAYQYHLVEGQKMPNLSPSNRRYEMVIGAWRRLPLPITRLLGPYIARRIP